MKTHTLLLLIMLTAAAAERNMEKRIFPLNPCPQADRQFHVKLVDVNNNLQCGGSLINKRWVLTAGHCANTKLFLLLGEHGITAAVRATVAAGVLRQEIPENQQFVFHDGNHCRDIMLVRLNLDAPTPNTLPVIRLPPKGCPRPNDGVEIRVAGFGPYIWDWNTMSYIKGGPAPPELHCADMDVKACRPTWPYPTTTDNTFCYARARVDTCGGDSGGGVVVGDVIYGVHVRSGSPSVCTADARASDVCHFRKWINNVLTDKKYDPQGPVGDPDYKPNASGCLKGLICG